MVQKRYEGFLNTPCLWQKDALQGLNQLAIHSEPTQFNSNIDNQLRLGKYIERFVSFELKQQSDITILAENIQIQEGKRTLGELDCLLLKNNTPIHLEIIYKFYLYDASVGDNEIDHFIGPNRKDSLIEKLTKLKGKQLPLLYNEACKPYLNTFNLVAQDIFQCVYFKAQLFIPFSDQEIRLKTLNQDCMTGYYINRNELKNFTNCKFYIPSKKDWLIIPSTHVNWMTFEVFNTITRDYFERQFSPMCWIKFNNGDIKRVFLVWW